MFLFGTLVRRRRLWLFILILEDLRRFRCGGLWLHAWLSTCRLRLALDIVRAHDAAAFRFVLRYDDRKLPLLLALLSIHRISSYLLRVFSCLLQPLVDINANAAIVQSRFQPLCQNQLELRLDADLRVRDASTRFCFSADIQPTFGCEIDALSAIEADVESRVISIGIGQDDLSWELYDPIQGYTVFS